MPARAQPLVRTYRQARALRAARTHSAARAQGYARAQCVALALSESENPKPSASPAPSENPPSSAPPYLNPSANWKRQEQIMSVLDDCFRGTGTDADQFRLRVLGVLERLPLIRERSPQVGDAVAKLEEVLRDFLAYAYGDRSNPSRPSSRCRKRATSPASPNAGRGRRPATARRAAKAAMRLKTKANTSRMRPVIAFSYRLTNVRAICLAAPIATSSALRSGALSQVM